MVSFLIIYVNIFLMIESLYYLSAYVFGTCHSLDKEWRIDC